ncbi:hypothetical protein ACWD62_04365 [Streptomyces sp. NPDC005146]
MANDEQYQVTVFSPEPQFAPRGGVVYIQTQLTEEETQAVREREHGQGRSVRMEVMA